MDEQDYQAWLKALEEGNIELGKKKERKRLIINFVIGCLPVTICLVWLWIR